MPAGRPRQVDPGTLYAVAHQLYWDFRRVAEGRPRWLFDKNKYEQLAEQAKKADLQLSDEQKARVVQLVEEEIRSGRLKETERADRLRDVVDGQIWAMRADLLFDGSEEARKEVGIPGEPDVLETLLDHRTTAEQVREICRDAFMSRTVKVGPDETREVEVSAWPIAAGSVLPGYLSQFAEQYVAALRDRRFPRCDVSTRPSNRLKQLWFLSRALAGALFGVTTRTAINLVGSKRPEQVFEESRDAKPARKRMRRRNKS